MDLILSSARGRRAYIRSSAYANARTAAGLTANAENSAKYGDHLPDGIDVVLSDCSTEHVVAFYSDQ
jgi:phage tail protein X